MQFFHCGWCKCRCISGLIKSDAVTFVAHVMPNFIQSDSLSEWIT